MRSDIYHFTKEFPDKEINKAWKNGEQIQGVAYGQEKWILISSTKTSFGMQRWATNNEFPADEIKEGWDEKYDIIFLSYVFDRWVVIQAEKTGYTDQIWRTSSRFPEKEIRQGIKDGYAVTALTYGVDRWAVVLSKGTDLTNQTFALYDEFPENAINEGWNNDLDITSMAFGNNQWSLVMSGNTGFVTQSWATRNSFEADLINEKAKSGNDVSGMFYAGDMWIYVFTTFRDETDTESGDGTSHESSNPVGNVTLAETDKEAEQQFQEGKKLSEKGDHEKAIVLFRKAILKDPKHYLAHNSLGVSLDSEGNKKEALECFRKAWGLDHKDAIILGNLVNQIIENQEYSKEIVEAVEKADQKVIGEITNGITLNNIGFAYAEDQQYDIAIEYYNKALVFDPDNSTIKENLEETLRLQADSHIGYYSPPEETPASESGPESEPAPESVEYLMKELNKLTGLDEIKRDVDALLKFIRVEKKRKERGIAVGSTTLHTVFIGPPGTGKTTMARLMGRFFKAMGLLKKGHVVEVDRSALVGEFIGQTAIKTNKVIDSALDGILFIDEAYSLVPSDARNDFGEEAVNTLVKRMEDHKHNLIVIVAGYADEMRRFINSNPGLQHRFTRYFYFNDYSPGQLTTIFDAICTEKKFVLTYEAEAKVTRYFDFIYRSKNKQFGNARTASNLFEEVVRYQSARLGMLDVDNLTDEELLTLTIEDITAAVQDEFEDKHVETVEEIMAELDRMVGLSEIKENVLTLINHIKTQQRLIAEGFEADEISLHSVFFGPPGTGKTTVARLIGRIYKAIGLLPKGQVIEVSRANLVAEFVGQTGPKTNAVIDSALHGILFIDEAYSLASSKGSNDFGHEAIEKLLKRMEDDRDKFAVIVAGYTAEMQTFISSNTGLESRFSNYFFFPDFTAVDLTEIFRRMVIRKRFDIDPDALASVEEFLTRLYNERSASFGNGRMVRNFYEKLTKSHSNRVAGLPNATRQELITFNQEDVINAIKIFITMIPRTHQTADERRPIGYRN